MTWFKRSFLYIIKRSHKMRNHMAMSRKGNGDIIDNE